jgi:hypothetical protein
VAGVGAQDDVDDGLFSGVIDFSDEIVVRLGGHGQAFDVERGPVDDRPGCASSFDGDVEHGVQSLRHGKTSERSTQGSTDIRHDPHPHARAGEGQTRAQRMTKNKRELAILLRCLRLRYPLTSGFCVNSKAYA